jgi:hypothetical protein
MEAGWYFFSTVKALATTLHELQSLWLKNERVFAFWKLSSTSLDVPHIDQI